MESYKKVSVSVVVMMMVLCSCAAPVDVNRHKRADSVRTLAEAYMREGNYIQALRELLAAEKMNPGDPLIQNDLGLTYMARRRNGLAATHFKKALELDPSYAGARNNLGAVHLAEKEWDKALACFKTLSDDLLYETPHYAYSNMGLVYYRMGEYAGAEKAYAEALLEKPGFDAALLGLGRTYNASGRPAMAVEILGKVPAGNRESAAVYLELGKAYEALGRPHEAHRNYNRALELDSEGPVGKDAGRLMEKMGG